MPETPQPADTDAYLHDYYEYRGETYSLTGYIIEYEDGRTDRRIEAEWRSATGQLIERVVDVGRLTDPTGRFSEWFCAVMPSVDPRSERDHRSAVIGAIEEFIDMELQASAQSSRSY